MNEETKYLPNHEPNFPDKEKIASAAESIQNLTRKGLLGDEDANTIYRALTEQIIQTRSLSTEKPDPSTQPNLVTETPYYAEPVSATTGSAVKEKPDIKAFLERKGVRPLEHTSETMKKLIDEVNEAVTNLDQPYSNKFFSAFTGLLDRASSSGLGTAFTTEGGKDLARINLQKGTGGRTEDFYDPDKYTHRNFGQMNEFDKADVLHRQAEDVAEEGVRSALMVLGAILRKQQGLPNFLDRNAEFAHQPELDSASFVISIPNPVRGRYEAVQQHQTGRPEIDNSIVESSRSRQLREEILIPLINDTLRALDPTGQVTYEKLMRDGEAVIDGDNPVTVKVDKKPDDYANNKSLSIRFTVGFPQQKAEATPTD